MKEYERFCSNEKCKYNDKLVTKGVNWLYVKKEVKTPKFVGSNYLPTNATNEVIEIKRIRIENRYFCAECASKLPGGKYVQIKEC